MSTQSAMKVAYFVPRVAKIFFERLIGLLRRISAPARKRVSHPITQKRITIFIVCLALLLDNMLYMVIVPIIEDYFQDPENTTTWYEEAQHRLSEENTTYEGSSTVTAAYNVSVTKETFLSDLKQKLEMVKPVKMQDYRNGLMGLLFASKAIVQLCVNPFTGAFIDRIGYITPLSMGLMVMFLSTVVFAGAETYAWLFIARSLQGFGSALANASSFGLIADRFQNEAERSKILGIALAFISFGSLVAPPFGGVLYEFVGRPVPFVILAIACLFDASLLLLIEKSSDDVDVEIVQPVGTPIHKLLLDPYILLIAGSLMVGNFPLAFLEPTIAEWMQQTMHADPWVIGFVWLPPFFPHVLGVYVTVRLSVKYFHLQWLYGAIGLVLIGISTAIVPACKSPGPLIVPLSVMCFGIALIDTALLPTLAFIVDTRHTSVYGSVYAIADISYSLAYALGPILAGQAVQHMGYLEMNLLIGMANVISAPCLFTLRRAYDRGGNILQGRALFTNGADDNDVEVPIYPPVEIQNPSGSTIKTATPKDQHLGEKAPLQITNRNYKAMESNFSGDFISTTITPRPRPQPSQIPLHSNIDLSPKHFSSQSSGF